MYIYVVIVYIALAIPNAHELNALFCKYNLACNINAYTSFHNLWYNHKLLCVDSLFVV